MRCSAPVNVLVGLETLKAGCGWSDAELHDAFTFNVQVRYAVGYENLGDGEFDLRTVYNFRHRLSDPTSRPPARTCSTKPLPRSLTNKCAPSR